MCMFLFGNHDGMWEHVLLHANSREYKNVFHVFNLKPILHQRKMFMLGSQHKAENLETRDL